MDPSAGPFAIHGPVPPATPVILSVPHGGRIYPDAMRSLLRIPAAHLTLIEDRHSDTLALAARDGETAIVARHGRTWIDLNRAEDDRDPLLEPGGAPAPRHASSKVRGGLGLIPRRTSATGDIWRRRLMPAEVIARVHSDHRPYHAALTAMAFAARARFGIAVIVDLHSMPPLGGADAPRVVIGDRFGRTAAARFAAAAEAAVDAAGLRSALNTPYAGGHVVERQGSPPHGIHAIQLEIDRSLYLDAALDAPGPGFDAAVCLVRRILCAVADAATGEPQAIAAE